jgi:hypothetical protein
MTLYRGLRAMPDQSSQNNQDDFFKNLFLFALFVFGTLVTVVYNIEYLVERVQYFSSFFIENGQGLPVTDHRLRKDVAVGLIFATLVLSFGLVHLSRRLTHYSRIVKNGPPKNAGPIVAELENALVEKTTRIEKLERYRETQRQSMKKIYHQLYKDLNLRRQSYVEIVSEYKIDDKGNNSVRQRIVLEAELEPVQFWLYQIIGDDVSKPMESIKDIDLKIRCLENGVGLEVVEFEDFPRYKSVIIWFLPEIAPNQRRTLEITYSWPGLWYELIQKGRTTYRIYYQGRSRLARGLLSKKFMFDLDVGNVGCEITAANPSGIELNYSTELGSQIWEFRGKDVPIANTPYELTFTTES